MKLEVYIVKMMDPDDETLPWSLFVGIPENPSVDHDFASPGAALDWVYKWANDRGIKFPVDPVGFKVET